MNVIRGGAGKPQRRADDQRPKKRKAREEEVDDSLVPMRIEVLHKGPICNVVPSHVWRMKGFKWNPVTFSTESEQLNSKFVEPNVQDRSLVRFLEDPRTPMIYGVSGNPDDSKAKYFAAFLVAAHLKALGAEANVLWAPMYGGFDNPYLRDDRASPTMVVLTGLTPNSTGTKLEKARDVLEYFPDVPRVVVVAGMDPLSFLTTRLHVPTHGLAYLSEALVRQKVEVI